MKVVVVELAGTVIVEDGTGSSALLLNSETDVPPVGAALFSVNVHVAPAPEVKVVALQVKPVRMTGADKVMVAGWETLPIVA